MIRNAFVFDGAAPAGLRVTKDLLQKGCAVFAASVPGASEKLQALKEKYPALTVLELDPLSDASVRQAAEAVSEKTDALDMLVTLCDKTPAHARDQIADGLDYTALTETFCWNALSPVRLVHHFLPLLDAGGGKRICLMTSRLSSNSLCEDTAEYGVHMAGTALNMAAKTLFNRLRPDGYTFRLFCYDREAEGERQGDFAAEYFTRDRSNTPEEQNHADENVLVLRDWRGRDVPW